MNDVLYHPLGPLPWALTSIGGSLRKTDKASLAKEILKDVPAADVIPQPSARIIDGMTMVQKIREDQKTFAEVADDTISMVLHEGTDGQRIDVVFNVYRDSSVKNAEREKRGSESGMNRETSRQTTRYINGRNFYPILAISRFWSSSSHKSGKMRNTERGLLEGQSL